jgi:acyl dehydratase
MGVNYGAGKVRFPSPVPVGSNLRLGAELTVGRGASPGTARRSHDLHLRGRGFARSRRCVAEVIFRYYV